MDARLQIDVNGSAVSSTQRISGYEVAGRSDSLATTKKYSPAEAKRRIGPETANSNSVSGCLVVEGREVNSVSYKLDGRLVAIGFNDKVQIWNVAGLTVEHTLSGHKQSVTHVAFSRNGSQVASASADKTIRVWNARTGQCDAVMQDHVASVSSVAWSPNGDRLVSGSWDTTLRVWNIRSNTVERILNGHTDWVHSVAWSNDGNKVASASSDQSVRVWCARFGTMEQVLVGHMQTVTSVDFSMDGVLLASGSLDRTLRVWDLDQGAMVACIQQNSDQASVRSVAFTPDMARVVVGCGDRCIRVWNLRTRALEDELWGHEDAVLGVAVGQNGAQLISCSHDGTARLWATPGSKEAPPPAPAPPPQPSAIEIDLQDKLRSSQGLNSLLKQQLQEVHGKVEQTNKRVQDHNIAASSLMNLEAKLGQTEATNQQLHHQLHAAQRQIEERNEFVRQREISLQEQGRRLEEYREMVNNLAAEKEGLARSLEQKRQELAKMPILPAGHRSNAGSIQGHSQRGRGARDASPSERPRRGSPTHAGSMQQVAPGFAGSATSNNWLRPL